MKKALSGGRLKMYTFLFIYFVAKNNLVGTSIGFLGIIVVSLSFTVNLYSTLVFSVSHRILRRASPGTNGLRPSGALRNFYFLPGFHRGLFTLSPPGFTLFTFHVPFISL